MKTPLHCAALALALTSPFASAQAWEADVRKFDAAFWDAYNQCDIKKLAEMNVDDLEFYHDQGGAMLGKEKFTAAMQNNICGNPAVRVRRAALAGSVRVFPMNAGGKMYGAVITGEHQFFNTANGKPEQLAGRALFTHLLVLKDGAWKVSRVLSYDHGAAAVETGLTEVALAAPLLERLAGTYNAKDKMVLVVKPAGGHLMVNAGGAMFELLPLSETRFFMKKRAIEVEFAPGQAGKGQRLVVRERGAIVAEATLATP